MFYFNVLININEYKQINKAIFCSQHAVLFVAVALALYQDLKAPPLAH